MNDSEILIIGSKGQLGLALQAKYPNARAVDSDKLDITDKSAVDNFDWSNVKTILNAAAYTNVDGAETAEGRVAAWKVNALALKNIASITRQHVITVVHISTDYVFDGTQDDHTEDEPFSPLSVYGASKAAGDLLVSQLDNYYILRTSWVIGEGKNFVKTMMNLANKNISPTVVSDQIGRLTFTSTLVSAIDHLLNTESEFGTYNVTNDGDPASWADVAREVFKLAGKDKLTVTDTTTAEYFTNKEGTAPRPLNSVLNLDKIQATGFIGRDWKDDLASYIKKELQR